MKKSIIRTAAVLIPAALTLANCSELSGEAKDGQEEAAIGEADQSADGAETSAASKQVAEGSGAERTPASEVDWGTDGGEYTNDDECDDPRFIGEGMTDTPLLAEDIKNDASDCRKAYEDGKLELK